MGKKTETKTTTAPYERNPWGPQVPYLEQGLQRAEDLYGYMTNTPLPDQYAGATELTSGAIQTGTDVGQQLLKGPSAAAALPGRFDQLRGDVAPIMAQVQDQYGNWRSATGELLSGQAGDPTQRVVSGAEMYAGNPYLDRVIESATRGVDRNLNENLMPQMRLQEAATGNVGSSRSGIVEGILRRSAQEQKGDIEANIRSQQYDAGLDRAARDLQTQFQNQAGLVGSLQIDPTVNADILQRITEGAAGAEATGRGLDLNRLTAGTGMINQAAATDQALAQLAQENEYMRWFQPIDAYNQYWGSVTNPLGEQGFNTQVSQYQKPSLGSKILGGAMMAGSLIAAPYTGGASLGLANTGASFTR